MFDLGKLGWPSFWVYAGFIEEVEEVLVRNCRLISIISISFIDRSSRNSLSDSRRFPIEKIIKIRGILTASLIKKKKKKGMQEETRDFTYRASRVLRNN